MNPSLLYTHTATTAQWRVSLQMKPCRKAKFTTRKYNYYSSRTIKLLRRYTESAMSHIKTRARKYKTFLSAVDLQIIFVDIRTQVSNHIVGNDT